jgi:hypothetical protein
MADDFLKKLQDSLQEGKKDDSVVDRLKEIDEKADKLTFQEAAENLDKRIEESGSMEELSEENRKKMEDEYAKLIAEQEKNDEKLSFLANIEQRNVEIANLKREFESVKKGYALKIAQIQEEKITLMGEFEKKYETKPEDEYNLTNIDPKLD